MHQYQKLSDELAYVKINRDYYAERWGRYSHSRYKGWNFICMFFPYEWMAYRKMYLEALLSFALVFALNYLLFFLPQLFFVWGLRLVFGALGNLLYWRKSQRMIRRTDGMNCDERLHYLQSRGGRSIVALIICIILEAGFLLFFYLLNMGYL